MTLNAAWLLVAASAAESKTSSERQLIEISEEKDGATPYIINDVRQEVGIMDVQPTNLRQLCDAIMSV